MGARTQAGAAKLHRQAAVEIQPNGSRFRFTRWVRHDRLPLAEDGFLYVTDSWNVLYKIDARSGDLGRIVWRMDPKQDRQMRSRGAALSGDLVITGAGGFCESPRIPASHKGKRQVVWGKSL